MSKDNSLYPMDDCIDCVHNRVCKYVDEIDRIKDSKTLPIDFSSALCNEYISGEDMGMSSGEAQDEYDEEYEEDDTEEPDNELQDAIQEAINDVGLDNLYEAIKQSIEVLGTAGYVVQSVHLCKASIDLLESQGKVIKSNKLIRLSLPQGNVPIVTDANIPEGEFEVTYVYDGKDER
jgi:DNA-directed RNA polymerase specialized sigma54-like protein